MSTISQTLGADDSTTIECVFTEFNQVCWTNRMCMIDMLIDGEPQRDPNVFERPDFADGYAIASLLFSSLSILVSLVAVGFVLWHRNKPVMRMSQFEFMLLLASSFTVFNTSLLLQAIGYMGYRPGICRGYFALFYISSTAIFVVLALKTYRALRLLVSTTTLQRLKISNCVLYSWLAIAELVVSALLTVWFIVYPTQINPCETVGLECQAASQSAESLGGVFDIILSSMLITLLTGTVVIAFLARRVPSVAGESRAICGAAFLFWFGVFVLVGLIHGIDALGVTVKSFITSIYFFLSTVISLFALVFSKARFFHMSGRDITKTFLEASTTTAQRKGHVNLHSSPSSSPTSSTHTKTHSSPTNEPGAISLDVEGSVNVV